MSSPPPSPPPFQIADLAAVIDKATLNQRISPFTKNVSNITVRKGDYEVFLTENHGCSLTKKRADGRRPLFKK